MTTQPNVAHEAALHNCKLQLQELLHEFEVFVVQCQTTDLETRIAALKQARKAMNKAKLQLHFVQGMQK